MTSTLTRPHESDPLVTLRIALADAREQHGRRSYQAREAFEQLFRTAAELGRPLDGLRIHSPVESERFFARTVPGPDGHVYWAGAKYGFVRNDRRTRTPRRWWWAQRSGSDVPTTTDVYPVCGDKACINPEHCEAGRSEHRNWFSDQQMLGALQVAALRLGHSPTVMEYRRASLHPSDHSINARFGSWPDAIRAAGLEPQQPNHIARAATRDSCLAAIREARETLGHWPNYDEFNRFAVQVRARGQSMSHSGVRRLFGTWGAALDAARKKRR